MQGDERGVDRVLRPAILRRLQFLSDVTAFGAVARLRPNCIVEDATVPVKRLPEMIRKVVNLSEKYHLRIGFLAHAGVGNLHPVSMTDL